MLHLSFGLLAIVFFVLFPDYIGTSKLHFGNEIYDVLTPGFELGNKEAFPLTAPVILSPGCSGISKISQSQIDSTLSSPLSSNFVALSSSTSSSASRNILVLVEESVSDASCFPQHHIFECQDREWCGGVLFEHAVPLISGLHMWSYFDKPRSRSEYKVPLAQISREDIKYFKRLISENLQNETIITPIITLTNDQNPWVDMFLSVPFILIFRALFPFSSIISLFIIVKVYKNYKKHRLVSRTVSANSLYSPSTSGIKYSFRKTSLKEKCLLFQFISHILKILFFIDPIISSQIYPYIVGTILTAGFISLQLSSSILLSFVIRELTHANELINVQGKLKAAYFFIIVFILIDLGISTHDGLNVNVLSFPSFYILAAYYVATNIGLGAWYFVQGYKFIKKCSQVKTQMSKKDQARLSLIQLSMFNSIGMILFGLVTVLIGVRQVHGRPWGNFCIYFFMLLILQITSLFEILLFGGVVIKKGFFLRFLKREQDNSPAPSVFVVSN
eukprot:c8162_g2_i3.p1 GENE.c8162_g2_i3~~c8162_g2_i3.p1  ORF type:complete len:510 (+),score=71.94 c8162_g2_i3:23-1531(+)